MWQEEPLRNRESKDKRESRDTRRLDENEVSDNKQSDKYEKPRTRSSLDEKPRTGGSLGCGRAVTREVVSSRLRLDEQSGSLNN